MPKSNSVAPGIEKRANGTFRPSVTWQGRTVGLGSFKTLGHAKTARNIALGQIASKTFTTPAEQRRRAAEQQALAAAEKHAANYTVAELFADWIAWQERRGLKEGTLYTRRSLWTARIEQTFGAVPVRDVTPESVTAWHDGIRAEGKAGAAREALATLSQMFSYATGTASNLPAGHKPTAENNPCHITTPGRRKPVREAHREVATPAEVSALAARMPDGERLAVLLAAWCGLRIGEVLGLRRRDLWTAPAVREGESEATFLRVERQVQSKGGLREETTKSRAGKRDVPVPAALLPVLQAHLRDWAGMGEDGLLFPSQRRGKRWLHPNTLRERFKTARDTHNDEQAAAGHPQLTGFVFHDLRKTALTTVGRAGATGAELMRFGGHADLETVQVYQRADLDRLARLAEQMNENVQVPAEPAPVIDLAAARARHTA